MDNKDNATYGEVKKEIPMRELEELLKWLIEARQPTIKFVSNYEEMKNQADIVKNHNIEMAIAFVQKQISF